MRPGEEHQAAKKALRRGNARRRCYVCLKNVRFLSFLVRAVLPVVYQQECVYGYRNDQWGNSCFQGEMQKSSPEIDTGDKRPYVSNWHFMCFAVFSRG